MQPTNCKTCEGTVSNDRPNAVQMAGKKFGKLTVLALACIAPRHWKCRCQCGNIVVCEGGNLRRGNSKSCGRCANVPRYSELRAKKERAGDGTN